LASETSFITSFLRGELAQASGAFLSHGLVVCGNFSARSGQADADKAQPRRDGLRYDAGWIATNSMTTVANSYRSIVANVPMFRRRLHHRWPARDDTDSAGAFGSGGAAAGAKSDGRAGYPGDTAADPNATGEPRRCWPRSSKS
jgi:hypothetical protein